MEDAQLQTGLLPLHADHHHQGMDQRCEILTSGQTVLRRRRAADADTVYQAVRQSVDHLLPWMPWARGYSREDVVRFTTQSEQDWDTGVAFQSAITTDDAVVGSCGSSPGSVHGRT